MPNVRLAWFYRERPHICGHGQASLTLENAEVWVAVLNALYPRILHYAEEVDVETPVLVTAQQDTDKHERGRGQSESRGSC